MDRKHGAKAQYGEVKGRDVMNENIKLKSLNSQLSFVFKYKHLTVTA
jgi:hypothetical protein